MGLIGTLIDAIKGSSGTDFLLISGLDLPDADTRPAFTRDDVYVELYVDSLRLAKSRSFATRFHGMVYSFVTLARESEASSEIAAVSKPDKIAELDEDSLGKVLTVNKQMMGAVPWRGGALKLELGLFSVKTGNLLTPVVDFVTRVSETAGVSFVGAVKPFIPLITEGMDMIAGQSGDSKLQIGIDTSIDIEGKRSSAFAIIAADKADLDHTKITIDPSDRKLLYEGEALKESYCVFSLRSAARKADWGAIPDIRNAYAKFREAAKSGKANEAEAALIVLQRTAIFSPDLIGSDAALINAKAVELMRIAFPGGGISAKADMESAFPEDLADLAIYE